MGGVRHATTETPGTSRSVLARLNGPWHERAMYVFLAVVLAHWAEHLAQAVQIYALGWARPESLGAVGLVAPWLVTSEWMHYGYAVVMLAGLWLLRFGMAGKARFWWDVALWIQAWHHLEHFLLLAQAVSGTFLFGAAVPMSIAQLVVPRVELHLFYNAAVFAPMVMAMLHHLYPRPEEARTVTCSCARRVVHDVESGKPAAKA